MKGPVLTPTSGIEPRTALATSIHAAPAVYAVLVGSEMSTAADIPTGWRVVQDLIRRIAQAEGVDVNELGDAPEDWWRRTGRPDARYDEVLMALASTDAARRDLLRKYFDPPPGEGGPVRPTAAHQHLAWLCSTGRVRLILTTNFDRLIERALDEQGISPQVIISAEAIHGMIPLQHAPFTLVKLHGDYADGNLRNTPEELASYPKPLSGLLARILNEYGLLVIGWSSDYDVALRKAFEGSASRRYPLYWASFNGELTESARRVIASRQATVIDTTGADEFLSDIVARLKRLDEIARRRTRVSFLRTYAFPMPSVPMPGWQYIPLLQLRAVVAIGPATIDTTGLIRPEDRDRLVTALRTAPLGIRLRYLSERPAASAAAEPDAADVGSPILIDWEATPGFNQSTEQASYRLGGDASAGVSVVVTARFPGFGRGGNTVVLIADIGVSQQQPIRLADAAMIWRDSLVLLSATLPAALSSVLPAEATIELAEIHAASQRNDGKNGSRENDLASRIDLSPLGKPSQSPLPDSIGTAARLSDALTEHDAAQLVVDAIEIMALDRSYLDPRIGISSLRYELGLSR